MSELRFAARALVFCVLAVAVVPASRASTLAGGDNPAGRGLQLLQARETALGNQTAQATETARRRGRMLYRLLLHEAAERRSGVSPAGAGQAPGGRAIALGTAVLARDLDEAAVLQEELERVREERRSAATVIPSPVGVAGAPAKLRAPVAGPITAPWGVSRDDATGGWLFRAGAGYTPRPGAPVVAPADGRVARVVGDGDGSGAWVLVLAHAGGMTTVLGGLATVTVAPHELIRAGTALGTAGPAVTVEVSRSRTPIDPATLFTTPGGHAARDPG